MKLNDKIPAGNCGYITELRNVKAGDFFKLTLSETAPVWIRGHFDRKTKTFSAVDYDDVNRETFCKASRLVWVDGCF